MHDLLRELNATQELLRQAIALNETAMDTVRKLTKDRDEWRALAERAVEAAAKFKEALP